MAEKKPKHLVDNPKGKPIVDATEDGVIEVVSGDISNATAMSPTDCAIARSCKRSVKGVIRATINKSVSYLEFKDKIVRFMTPQSAAREIIAIDRGGAFASGTYYLKRPSQSSKLGQRPGRPRGKKDGSRGARERQPHVTVMVRGA